MIPVALSGPDLQLPWFSTVEEDGRFYQTLRMALAACALCILILLFYPLPDESPVPVSARSPALAQVVLEKQTLPPAVKPKNKPKPPETKSPKSPALPQPSPAKKPAIAPKPPVPTKRAKKNLNQQQQRQRAQAKAASSGLLQFADDLAAMRDVTVATVDHQQLQRGATTAKQTRRALVGRAATAASGGIQVATSSQTLGGQALVSREATQVNSRLANQKTVANQRKMQVNAQGRLGVSRSEEAIRQVIDRNKARIDTAYQRALRRNPNLGGRLVVKLVIEPSGQVSAVTLVSSELGDPALEQKLLTRIRLIHFGTAAVTTTQVNYTFAFYPQ